MFSFQFVLYKAYQAAKQRGHCSNILFPLAAIYPTVTLTGRSKRFRVGEEYFSVLMKTELKSWELKQLEHPTAQRKVSTSQLFYTFVILNSIKGIDINWSKDEQSSKKVDLKLIRLS